MTDLTLRRSIPSRRLPLSIYSLLLFLCILVFCFSCDSTFTLQRVHAQTPCPNSPNCGPPPTGGPPPTSGPPPSGTPPPTGAPPPTGGPPPTGVPPPTGGPPPSSAPPPPPPASASGGASGRPPPGATGGAAGQLLPAGAGAGAGAGGGDQGGPAFGTLNAPGTPTSVLAYEICPMPIWEKQALLEFYVALDGLNWRNQVYLDGNQSLTWPNILNDGWLNSTAEADDPCRGKWLGVECWTVDTADQLNTCTDGLGSLVLSIRGLFGTLPRKQVFSAFKGLRRIDLSGNGLYGSLKPLEGMFENMAAPITNPRNTNFWYMVTKNNVTMRTQLPGPSIDFSNNYFTEGLPVAALNQVTSLYYISFQNNLLTSNIESLFAYDSSAPKQYRNLISIDMCCNKWSGRFPAGWATTVPNLISFDFSDCSMQKQVLPADLPMGSLQRILLAMNSFYGSIPATWSAAAPNLIDISLYQNNLTGPLPAFIGNTVNLQTLLLHSNSFSGNPWSAICGTVTRVTKIFFSVWNNEFSGLIDPCMADLLDTVLKSPFGSFYPAHTLSLEYNKFNNSLSDTSLQFLTTAAGSIDYMYLRNNEFTAHTGFNAYWSDFNSLQLLDISSNPLGFDVAYGSNGVAVPNARSGNIYQPLNGLLADSFVNTVTPMATPASEATAMAPMQTMGQLIQLDLSSCQLTGNINYFLPLDTLNRRKPSTGTNAPAAPVAGNTHFDRLVTLDLRNNSLSGDMTAGMFAALNALTNFDISLNPALKGSLTAYGDFESLSATGNPLLSWASQTGLDASLPVGLQIDSSTPYTRDSNAPGRICPVFSGSNDRIKSFKVDATYYEYQYCDCDSGYYALDPLLTNGTLWCQAIPANTTLSIMDDNTDSSSASSSSAVTTHGVVEKTYASPSGSARLLMANAPATPAADSSSTASFSDALFGHARMLIGLDTTWTVDARSASSSNIIRTISLDLQFHPNHFVGDFNRLEIFMGNESLTGDRVQAFTGAAITQHTTFWCYSEASQNVNRTYKDGLAVDLDPNASPFNDTRCVYRATVNIYGNQATINFRSRDQSSTHFVASYVVSSQCPDTYSSPDSLVKQISEGSVPVTPSSTTEAWCAPVFKLQSTLQGVVIGVASLVALIELYLIGCIIHYRDHSVMKSATPEYLILVILGLLLLDGGAVTFALSPSLSNGVCSSRIWLVGLGVMLSLTAFDMKTERIRQIYSAATLKRRTMSFTTMAIVLCIIVSVEVGLLILQQALDMYSSEVVYGNGSTLGYVVATCSSNSKFLPWIIVQIIFMFLLLWWGAYNSWKIRKAATAFNESNTAAASVVLYMFFAVALLPLQSFLSDQPNAQMLIMGLGLAICSLLESVATVCIKLYYIRTNARPLAALLQPIPTKLELPGEASGVHANPALIKALDLKKGPNGSNPKQGSTPKPGTGAATPKGEQQLQKDSASDRAFAHHAIPGMFKTPTTATPNNGFRGIEDAGGLDETFRIANSNQFKIPSSLANQVGTDMGTNDSEMVRIIRANGGTSMGRSTDAVAGSKGINLTSGQTGRSRSGSLSREDSLDRHDRLNALSMFSASANPLSAFSYAPQEGVSNTGFAPVLPPVGRIPQPRHPHAAETNESVNPLSMAIPENSAYQRIPSMFQPNRSKAPNAGGEGSIEMSQSWMQPSRPMGLQQKVGRPMKKTAVIADNSSGDDSGMSHDSKTGLLSKSIPPVHRSGPNSILGPSGPSQPGIESGPASPSLQSANNPSDPSLASVLNARYAALPATGGGIQSTLPSPSITSRGGSSTPSTTAPSTARGSDVRMHMMFPAVQHSSFFDSQPDSQFSDEGGRSLMMMNQNSSMSVHSNQDFLQGVSVSDKVSGR